MMCPKPLIAGATVEIHFHITAPVFGKSNARSKLVKDLSIITDVVAHLKNILV
jgi:hypothetical protein